MVIVEQGHTRIDQVDFRRFEEQFFYPPTQELKRRLQEHPAAPEILKYLAKYEVPIDVALEWPTRSGAVLSDLGIIRHMLAGNIVIYPFNSDQLSANSYDVTLGEYYKRCKDDFPDGVTLNAPPRITFDASVSARLVADVGRHWQKPMDTYNPFDPQNVDYMWQLYEAEELKRFERKYGVKFNGLSPEDKIILLRPQEMILAHTQEFIGGVNVVATKISGTSTAGRSMIELCSDADFGKIGYFNRWTLEIHNKSGKRAIPLLVGQPYAQIIFMESQPCAQTSGGTYQKGETLEEVVAEWTPDMMTPRMKRKAV